MSLTCYLHVVIEQIDHMPWILYMLWKVNSRVYYMTLLITQVNVILSLKNSMGASRPAMITNGVARYIIPDIIAINYIS